MAGDLIEADGLDQREDEGKQGEARDAPPAQPKSEQQRRHGGSALCSGSSKKLRKTSSRLGSVLTRSTILESRIACSRPSKFPWTEHVIRRLSTVTSSTPRVERSRDSGISEPG